MDETRQQDGHGDYEQPPIAEYGLISDRRAAALVSRRGAIDWCCMPRFDSGALFCRLLDGDGGHCTLTARDAEPVERRYADDSLVIETRWRGSDGEAKVLDYFEAPEDSRPPTLVRLVEGVRGKVEFEVTVEPRFDYGAVKPWIRGGDGSHAAIGGNDGLLISADFEIGADGRYSLAGGISVQEGERRRLTIFFRRPTELDGQESFEPIDPEAVDEGLRRTQSWWQDWCAEGPSPSGSEAILQGAVRSALILKALSYEETGAVAAAATTSLPEARALSGERNWDYRFSWIRDSALSVRSLAELGWNEDSDRFRRFIERSSAGHADDLQVVFGVGGERRMPEQELEEIGGYRGARPVRLGNGAAGQFQLDALGQLLDQSWSWHQRGNTPDDDYWHFIADLVDVAARDWRRPDKGIWEWREGTRHFVHSKALAWSALDRGIRLAEDTGRPVGEEWRRARDEVREAIEERGFDSRLGCFVQAFDHADVDAAVLRLPTVGFLDWDDERMVSTADVVRERLDFDGLLRRYDADDGMPEEGAFLACSFWLATLLAKQGRAKEATATFQRAEETANDLGLFPEEYDPEAERMLGNLPQALTHLSHIEAALALASCAPEQASALVETAS